MRYFKVLLVMTFAFISIAKPLTEGQGSIVDDKRKHKEFIDALQAVGTEKEDENAWLIIEKGFNPEDPYSALATLNRVKGIKILSEKAKALPDARVKIISFLANITMDKFSHSRSEAMRAIADYTEMLIVVEAITRMLTDENIAYREDALEIVMTKRLAQVLPVLKTAAAQEKVGWLKKRMAEAVTLLEKLEKEGTAVDVNLNAWLKQAFPGPTDEEAKQFFNALRVVGSDDEDAWSIIEKIYKCDYVGLHLVGIRTMSGKAEAIPASRAKIVPFLAMVAMEDKDDKVRRRAIGGITHYTEMPIVIQAITKMLTDEHKLNRQRALEVVVRKRLTQAIPALKKADAQESDNTLKEKMTEAITLLKKGRREPIKVESNAKMNIWFEQLNSADIDADLDIFLEQLNNPDPQKRRWVVSSLEVGFVRAENINKVIEALIQTYNKESLKDNKIQILVTLAVKGGENDALISLLKKEATGEDEEIRKIAKTLLKSITGGKIELQEEKDVEEILKKYQKRRIEEEHELEKDK